uniref:Transcriptional repressor n=1 Tax=Ammonifex degensii TaxID=42838 RepID=A0A7C1FD53_9THEO
MQKELESFRDFLVTRGGKLTAERKIIIEVISSFQDHFTAEELLDEIKARGARVSRASVYRALDLLVASNLLRKLDLGENRSYYERYLGTHHHLVCVRCNRVIEFAADPMENLEEELFNRLGFDARGFPQKILGRCSACCQTQPKEELYEGEG